MNCEVCGRGWASLVIVAECHHCADCCECPDEDTSPYTASQDIADRHIRAQEAHDAEPSKIIGFFYEVEDQDRDEGAVLSRDVRFQDGDRVYHVEIPANLADHPIEAYVYDRKTETMVQHRKWDRK